MCLKYKYSVNYIRQNFPDTIVFSYIMSSTLRVEALFVVLNICIKLMSFCSLDFTE